MPVQSKIVNPQMDLLLDADARYRTVAGPKLFFVCCFFPWAKGNEWHKVKYKGREYKIGGVHPLPRPGVPLPRALDIRHCRALFALASFRSDSGNDGRVISFSMYAFAKRFAASTGGAYQRRLRELLGDLVDTWIEVKEEESGKILYARLLEKVEICQTPIRRRDAPDAVNGQMDFRFQAATLSDWFYEMLACIESLLYLKFDVFRSIRSPLAQCLYMFIPSRCIGKTAAHPWEIGLTKLFAEIGVREIPAARSKRIQLMCQNKNSVLDQLNGLPISRGCLRVALRVPEDRNQDAFLQVWQEQSGTSPAPAMINTDSKVYQAWVQNGGPEEEYQKRLRKQRPIDDDYELRILRSIGVDLVKDRVFLKQLRALIGADRFKGCLAETKDSAKDPGFHLKKGIGSLLGGRLMEALRLEAQASSKSKTIY
jgi:hypothetical protein